jgi:hypothetical protein
MMPTLGLIAGAGDLPRAVAEGARMMGYRVFAVGLAPLADESLAKYVDEFTSISVGQLGAIIKALKKASIAEAVMSGKVPKSLIYKSKIVPDMKAVSLLMKLRNRSDDSIMLAITAEFEKEGIRMRDITDFTEDLLAPLGVLTKGRLSEDEQKDIDFGYPIARNIGRLDIGQTVVIKTCAVMAVEAIEGTDQAIRRGGGLAGDGAVVIKTSKPVQDKRFDFPVVGADTVRSMAAVKARVLAVEAGRTLIVSRVETIKEAERAGITIVGVKPTDD